MTTKVIGTCGNCKGAVTIPELWYGVQPPTPTCLACGSIPLDPYGARIKMRPRALKDAGGAPGTAAHDDTPEVSAKHPHHQGYPS